MNTDDFAGLYASHYNYFLGIALNILRDQEDARDIVHDAFAKALAAGIEVREPLPWLATITYNTANSAIRRRQTAIKNADRVAAMTVMTAPGADTGVIAEDTAVRILAELLPGQRRVAQACLEAGSQHGAAAALGISPGTVKKHMFRARARLRELEWTRG